MEGPPFQEDARHGDVGIALQLFEAIHARWLLSLRQMTPEQFARTFFIPIQASRYRSTSPWATTPGMADTTSDKIRWLRDRHVGRVS